MGSKLDSSVRCAEVAAAVATAATMQITTPWQLRVICSSDTAAPTCSLPPHSLQCPSVSATGLSATEWTSRRCCSESASRSAIADAGLACLSVAHRVLEPPTAGEQHVGDGRHRGHCLCHPQGCVAHPLPTDGRADTSRGEEPLWQIGGRGRVIIHTTRWRILVPRELRAEVRVAEL